MTLEQWMALPSATRLELLYTLLHSQLATLPVPAAAPPATSTTAPRTVPTGSSGGAPADVRPPRFDTRIPRRGGFQWASETELESLVWWRDKKAEDAKRGGQYADRDAKLAKEIDYFVAWRRAFPAAQWQGTRGEQRVTAAAPVRDPEVHPWPGRGPQRLDTQPSDFEAPAGESFSERDYGARSDDEIPF